MKLINRNSEEIIMAGGRSISRQYIIVEKYRIYFTAAATRVCRLKEGMFVQFLNEGDQWNFFINDDPEGFKLSPVRAKKAFNINNTGLSAMILKSMNFKDKKRFSVERTEIIQDHCPVFKLSLKNVPVVRN